MVRRRGKGFQIANQLGARNRRIRWDMFNIRFLRKGQEISLQFYNLNSVANLCFVLKEFYNAILGFDEIGSYSLLPVQIFQSVVINSFYQV